MSPSSGQEGLWNDPVAVMTYRCYTHYQSISYLV